MTLIEIRNVLGWCSLINVLLIAFGALLVIALRSEMYKIHSKFFPMDEQQYSAVMFSCLGLYKLLIVVFNIVPYIALWIVTAGA
ncbi:DUF6868 family protein [Sedimentisphaera salicampi]|uniref:DUF6868 family protein n=1 Tax=Sedimentisphaera salicampi TaxID=1941349 RepID=UPI000B9BA0D0|nr:hypothetical protein [Sedimentisphaera salicampi]OXU14709.1 hypothetical protein SMSP1_01529 [Sedimentisphaera salicampi]